MMSRSEWTTFGKVACNDMEKVLLGQVKEFVPINLQMDNFAPVEALKQQQTDKFPFSHT